MSLIIFIVFEQSESVPSLHVAILSVCIYVMDRHDNLVQTTRLFVVL